MRYEKDGFDLRAFLILILRQVKVLFIFVMVGLVVGMGIGGLYGYKQYAEVGADSSKNNIEYLYDQREVVRDGIKFYENYNIRPLMMLNPTSVSITHISLFIATDYVMDNTLTIQPTNPVIDIVGAYCGMPISSHTLERINDYLGEDYDKASISELISFVQDETDETTSILNLYVYGKNENESSFIARAFIEGAYELINPTVYRHRLVVIGESSSISSSEELAKIQKDNFESATAQTQRLQSELSLIDGKISMLNPVNIAVRALKYGILCGAAMLILGIILVLILDSLDSRLWLADAYLKRYSIPVMGKICLDEKKKKLFGRTIYYLENGTKKLYISSKERLDLVRENVLIRTGDLSGKTVLLTGSVGHVQLSKTAKAIAGNFCENSIPSVYYDNKDNLEGIYGIEGNETVFIISPSPLESGNTVKILKQVDYIFLVENPESSSSIELDSLMHTMEQLDAKPLGFILIDYR